MGERRLRATPGASERFASEAPEMCGRDAEWRPLALGKDLPARYGVEAWKDRFYVVTNEGAPRWRIFGVDPAHPERASWKEIVPEAKDSVIDEAQIIGNTGNAPFINGTLAKSPCPVTPAL